jgi:hypothetical protein
MLSKVIILLLLLCSNNGEIKAKHYSDSSSDASMGFVREKFSQWLNNDIIGLSNRGGIHCKPI